MMCVTSTWYFIYRFLVEAHTASKSMAKPTTLPALSTHLRVRTDNTDSSTSLKVTRQLPPGWMLLLAVNVYAVWWRPSTRWCRSTVPMPMPSNRCTLLSRRRRSMQQSRARSQGLYGCSSSVDLTAEDTSQPTMKSLQYSLVRMEYHLLTGTSWYTPQTGNLHWPPFSSPGVTWAGMIACGMWRSSGQLPGTGWPCSSFMDTAWQYVLASVLSTAPATLPAIPCEYLREDRGMQAALHPQQSGLDLYSGKWWMYVCAQTE